MEKSGGKLFRAAIACCASVLASGGTSSAVAQPSFGGERKRSDLRSGLERVSRFASAPSDAEIFGARVFEEPLVPIGTTSPSENRALAGQLEVYLASGGGERLAPIEQFLAMHPRSAWRASLLGNVGVVHRRTGRISRALDAWAEAWSLSKGATDTLGRAVADRALGEYAGLLARLGRTDALQSLLKETAERPVGGSAAEKLVHAKDGLALMRTRPDLAFRCGPMALGRVLAALRPSDARSIAVDEFPSTSRGTSLAQVWKLSNDVGQHMQMARRPRGASTRIPLPAVIHWKSGHFAALVREEQDRYLVEDGTFGDHIWISRAALDEEASGYALIATNTLPRGWSAVDEAEGATVWGRGATETSNPENYKPCDPKITCGKCTCEAVGMATYDVHLMLVSLNIVDEPVGYSPPIGPAVRFRATYNQREVYQPQIFSYSNLGPKWTFGWLSYITDDPSNPLQDISVYIRGGGRETYTFDLTAQRYGPHKESRAVIVRTSTQSPTRYERRLPDGSVEVFARADNENASPRKIFMTEWIDAQGNSTAFAYDSTLRLSTVTAADQVTTLHYDLPGDNLKITKVTDPFDRFATFEYTAGRLTRITDVMGIASEFQYVTGDFISTLTTPYGATTFEKGETGTTGPRSRWLLATDALGGRERVEYHSDPGPPHNTNSSDPDPVDGWTFPNVYLNYRNTFYWDKRAMAEPGPLNYSKARNYHWLHMRADDRTNSGILESTKAPLENRVWFRYPGDADLREGTHAQPAKIGRLLAPGAKQISEYSYNLRGKVCERTDPKLRKTRYTYGTGTVPDPTACTEGWGIDLLKVEQWNGSTWEQVQATDYNTQHLPIAITDASLQTTTLTYLADGRLETVVTPPRNGLDCDPSCQPLTLAERTTTYEYYPSNDADLARRRRLMKVTGPSVGTTPGSAVSFAYDTRGRVATTTDSDNYTVATTYDDLDRLRTTTYPDGTYEEITYGNGSLQPLDAYGHRDRLGRWSYTHHDALRRLWKMVGPAPLSPTVTMHWCPTCGTLDGITDAEGHRTTWMRDLQGRIESEIRADNSTWRYGYEPKSGRLSAVTDPMQRVKTYTYDLDDKLTGITYPNGQPSTHDVTYTFHPDPYGRLLSMSDGTGVTTYAYHEIGQGIPPLGALRLKSVNGPLADDLIEYSYDEMGRVQSRKLNGAREETYRFDALGRVRLQTTPVGPFTFTYDGVTSRLLRIDYPHSQNADYSYHPAASDFRLEEIDNTIFEGGATLSRFVHTYQPTGNLETWLKQSGEAQAGVYLIDYDVMDRLRHFVPSPSGPAQPTYEDTYDLAGNRLTHRVDSSVRTATYDSRNRILSYGPVGTPPATYAHDDSGNMTSDDVHTFEWDSENRLVSVWKQGALVADFAYDGYGRRHRKTADGVTHTYVYDGQQIIEERLSSGGAIRYFDGPGVDQHLAYQYPPGVAFFYATDHLGSVTSVTRSNGAVSLTRQYDPWGNIIEGSTASGYAFTGREWDAETGLYYYRARYYDPKIGRFISEDDRYIDGPNLYPYVRNNPTSYVDPRGHEAVTATVGAIALGGTAPAWAVPVGVAVTGAVAIKMAWDIGEVMADRLFPLPPLPPSTPVTGRPPGGGTTTMGPPAKVIPFPVPQPKPTSCPPPPGAPPKRKCFFQGMTTEGGEIGCLYDCKPGLVFYQGDGGCPPIMEF